MPNETPRDGRNFIPDPDNSDCASRRQQDLALMTKGRHHSQLRSGQPTKVSGCGGLTNFVHPSIYPMAIHGNNVE
jgi:hypothetical protein